MFSSRNLQISCTREQGERSRRNAVFWYTSVCCTSNSPFGAWVVCVYRVLALQSLDWIDAATHAFLYSLKIWCDSLLDGADSIGVNDGGYYDVKSNQQKKGGW